MTVNQFIDAFISNSTKFQVNRSCEVMFKGTLPDLDELKYSKYIEILSININDVSAEDGYIIITCIE